MLSSGKSKEAEVKRINKELANIRSKFKGKIFVASEVYLVKIKGQLGTPKSSVLTDPGHLIHEWPFLSGIDLVPSGIHFLPHRITILKDICNKRETSSRDFNFT